MTKYSYFFSFIFILLISGIATFGATASSSPTPSPKVDSCKDNPNASDAEPLCLGSCVDKAKECIFGIPPGSPKGTKSTCHCEVVKKQP